jgi:hypothetical protein
VGFNKYAKNIEKVGEENYGKTILSARRRTGGNSAGN